MPFLDHDIFDPLSAQLGGQLKRKQRVESSANKVSSISAKQKLRNQS